MATLHQFPDRQLVGEDVVWTAYEDGSFLSSHRLISVMRHTGDGSYGKATGRLLKTRIIADCWVVDQVVTEEWLVRDQAAFARCLGKEPRALALEMAERRSAHPGSRSPTSFPNTTSPACTDPKSRRGQRSSSTPMAIAGSGATRSWRRSAGSISTALPSRRRAARAYHGHSDIDRFYLGYLSAFPDAAFTLESAMVNRDPGRAVRVALRWSVRGTHTGFGIFGPPSGAPIYIMGLSHATVIDGRVRQEWIAIDEVVIWKQIIAHQRKAAAPAQSPAQS